MQEVKSVSEADVAGKRVLLRLDFDVPLHDGKVVDDTRLLAAVPTLELLHKKGAAKIIIIAHVGRPEGKVDESLRVAPIEARVRELAVGPEIEVRENLRFDSREEAPDDSFAQELAKLGDIYVNEAFADSHREHASIVGVPKYLPHYAGLHFMQEVERLSHALKPPAGSIAIVGGAKFETKQPVLEKLLPLYEKIFVGGAIANDILKARGLPVGASLVSRLPVPEAIAGSDHIFVESDAVFAEHDAKRTGYVTDTRANEKIVDVGTQTATQWAQQVVKAPFVLWNGPLGLYEAGFIESTHTIAQAIGQCKLAVIGGGDTVAAVKKYPFDASKVFLSTGGGAMLDFLVEGTLPGIEALKQ